MATTDTPLINVDSLLLEREDMDAGVVEQLRTALGESGAQFGNLKNAIRRLEDRMQAGKVDEKKASLKLGIAYYLLGRTARAAQFLENAKSPLGQFYLGLALNDLLRYEAALKALESAQKAGYAAAKVAVHQAAAHRGLGNYDQARKLLDGLEEYTKTSGDYLYQYGALLALQGREAEAVSYYERAIKADPRHTKALFQLAYENDMAGNDEEAIQLYERCLQIPPVHVGTLMNLGVLYEDIGRDDKARRCYLQILQFYPNHARARLFLRDASDGGQHFEEEDDRSFNRYDAKLDTPIDNFELTVRSRNCLKRMNVQTLGDLTRCTEQHLLASKNFGETSLVEIRELLEAQGLTLGSSGQEKPQKKQRQFNPDEYSPQERTLLAKSVTELNLSVRARKCMTRLGINTLGDLMMHTSDELLECKNFGITSLFEIREKLGAFNLKLRGD